MQKYKKRKIFPLGSEDAFTKVFDVPEFFLRFSLIRALHLRSPTILDVFFFLTVVTVTFLLLDLL